MSFETIAFVAVGLVAAFASGLAGFAFALLALSLWIHVVPARDAVPIVVASSLIIQTMAMWRLRKRLRLDLLWPFLVGGLVGVPIGSELMTHADPVLFRRAVGVFLLLYGAFMLLQPPLPAFVRGGRIGDGAIGAIAGAMGGAAGFSGAIMPIWCDLRGWPKDDQRGVYQPFIFVMQGVALATFGISGTIDSRTLGLFAIAAPAVLLGGWAGLAVYDRIDPPTFRRVLLVMLLVSGVVLLV